jgi:UTP-glucose-1-phosphate uridylyltransferase
MNVKKAVIPAAGLGTRFLPATKAQAKEMLPIVDKPAIQYIVEEAVQFGIESIIMVSEKPALRQMMELYEFIILFHPLSRFHGFAP